MATLNRDILNAARSAYRWGSCGSIDHKIRLFQTFEDERPIYLAVEENPITLLCQFDDSDAKIAFNVMDV